MSRLLRKPWMIAIAAVVGMLWVTSCTSTAVETVAPAATTEVSDPGPTLPPPTQTDNDFGQPESGQVPAPVESSETEPVVEEPAVVVEEPPEPEVLQQEALDLCQSAAEFLDQGNMEDAIAALDRAYDLMLELPNNGDNGFLQAKNDIRVLVAELIVRTYESQRSVARGPVIAWDLDLPIVDNKYVQREIRSFTTTEWAAFEASYRRSGIYRPMILKKLQEAGLPSQLSWLPLVESNFKVRALSRASALGLWQFIASTGQRYGLKRDSWIDQRMDPEKSTDAAIAYLSELHGIFGDWPKALAAYNCGEGRVMRLQRRNPGEYLDFWDLYELLPRETRRYVPRFFASLAIIEDAARHKVSLPEPMAAAQWTTVPVNKSVQLKSLDRALGLEEGSLHALNPELRHKATPKSEYELKVPPEQSERLVSVLTEVPVWSPPTPQYVTHRVRRGETLSAIASRYRTSVSAITRANNMRSAHRIWPGQRLKIPVRGASGAVAAAPNFDAAQGTHTVRRGESLYSIASRYNTTVAKIKSDNNLGSNLIHPGQKLKVRPGAGRDLSRYQVKKGDTLGAIARAHGVTLSALLRVNSLRSRSTIYPGQWLAIPD